MTLVFDQFIRASANGRRRKPDGTKISDGTVANYRNTLRLINDFSSQLGVSWEVSTSLRMTKLQFRQRKNYWERFHRQFTDYLYSRDYYDNYVANIFKNIRCVMRYLNQQYGWQDHLFLPYKWVRPEEVAIDVINPEQLKTLIYDKSFYQNLDFRLRRIRKIVITGCLTSLRASDLLNLRSRNLENVGFQSWLVVRSKKTRQLSRLLLPEVLKKILTPKSSPSSRLLPRISNVNLNLGIKRLAEVAGWTWPVSRTRNRRSIPLIQRKTKGTRFYRFCDVLTTHSLRRSAITLLLRAGMPETLVRQVSGHRPGSREFHRYVAISQDWLDEHTEKAYATILN